jgi:hypothetical protein
MKKLRYIKKVRALAITVFLAILLALVSVAAAAGGITLTPTAQAPGGSVTVNGTGFGATKAVGIGFGAEINGSEINMAYSGTGMGPYSGRISHYPIKPGSFLLISDTTPSGMVSYYTDNGDGTTTGPLDGMVGTIDYVTGNWSRTTTVDVTDIPTNYTASYTYFANDVTPAAGVTTLGSGAFSASITVPSVANGVYTVTAMDTQGNMAVSSLTVDNTIPEGLTVGLMVLLSTVAVIVSIRYFRKQPKIKTVAK